MPRRLARALHPSPNERRTPFFTQGLSLPGPSPCAPTTGFVGLVGPINGRVSLLGREGRRRPQRGRRQRRAFKEAPRRLPLAFLAARCHLAQLIALRPPLCDPSFWQKQTCTQTSTLPALALSHNQRIARFRCGLPSRVQLEARAFACRVGPPPARRVSGCRRRPQALFGLRTLCSPPSTDVARPAPMHLVCVQYYQQVPGSCEDGQSSFSSHPTIRTLEVMHSAALL